LVLDSSGDLYGTTYAGGSSTLLLCRNAGGCGTVFKLDTSGTNFAVLHNFSLSDGEAPAAGLILTSSGNLYGTTNVGGLLTVCTAGCGTVFKLDTSGSNFAVLHNFSITDGSNPSAGLILDPSGNLYGTTAYGGSANQGTVFKIPAAGGTLTVLRNFGDDTVANDGAIPFAGLILDASGSLYGTTNVGGSSGVGTVFELATTLRETTQIIVNQMNAIIDQVNTLYAKSQLKFGQDNWLVEHLQQALSLVKKGKNAGAIQTLQGFIYEVGGLQSSNVLTSAQAGPFITEADVIVAELR